MPPSSGTRSWNERPFRWMPAVASCTLQMPRTRSRLPGSSPANAPGGRPRIEDGRERGAVGVEQQRRAIRRRDAFEQAGLDLAPAARRRRRSSAGSGRASAARPASPPRRAGPAHPRRSGCRRCRWRGSRSRRRRRRRADRADRRSGPRGRRCRRSDRRSCPAPASRWPRTRIRRPARSGVPKRSSRSIGQSAMPNGSAAAGDVDAEVRQRRHEQLDAGHLPAAVGDRAGHGVDA